MMMWSLGPPDALVADVTVNARIVHAMTNKIHLRYCPKCGFRELYWRPLKFNTDVEYAHTDNVPFASEIPFNEKTPLEREGYVYWRSGSSKKYIQRLPLVFYREWGNKIRPKGTYTESYQTRKKHELETTNQKLGAIA